MASAVIWQLTWTM